MSKLLPNARLPSYEGHLILNQALLSNASQTSNSSAWSETWCSLEDGRLLVYADHTAALISPELTSAIIDIRRFACAQVSPEPGFQLVLSTYQPPELYKCIRLFSKRSAPSLNQLRASCAPDDTSSKSRPRPSNTSSSRPSTQLPPLSFAELSTMSAIVDPTDRSSAQSQPWSKFASDSRRLYPKISTASNDSLRSEQDSSSGAHSNSSSSAASVTDTSVSTDLASNPSSSPCTPCSSTCTSSPERITIRVASAQSLRNWSDAFTLTIKMYHEAGLAPSPMPDLRRGDLSRPSLANLPGFRARVPLPPSLATPWTSLEEATPKASCQNCSTITSSPALQASMRLQEKLILGDCAPTNSEELVMDKISLQPGTTGLNEQQQNRIHRRSLSMASSPMLSSAAKCPTIGRRNSVSGAHPSSTKTYSDTAAEPLDSELESCKLSHSSAQASRDGKDVGHHVAMLTSAGAKPDCRHGRSESLLQYGSARILAWRDAFAAVDPPVATDTCFEPDLDIDHTVATPSSLMDLSREAALKAKTGKKSPKFKSLRKLTRSKSHNGPKIGFSDALQDVDTGSVSSAEPRLNQDRLGSHASMFCPFAEATSKSKGSSKASSLFSITKNRLGCWRPKAPAQRHVDVRTIFAATCPDMGDVSNNLQIDTLQIRSPDCDFSYELVEAVRGANRVESPVIVGGETTRISVADEPTVVDQFCGQIDDNSAEDLAALQLRHPYSGWKEDAVSPRLHIQRILPPEQMIKTFDELRAACLNTRQDVHQPQRGSLGRSTSVTATTTTTTSSTRLQRPPLRPTVSQTSVKRDDASLTAPRRLQRPIPGWELGGATQGDVETDLGMFGYGSSGRDPAQRSLPAPPRAVNRRARILLSESDVTQPVHSNASIQKPNSTSSEIRFKEPRRAFAPLAAVNPTTPAAESPTAMAWAM